MKIIFLLSLLFNFLFADTNLKCEKYNSFKQPEKYINCLNNYIDKNDFVAKKQMAEFYYKSQEPYRNYKKAIEWYMKVEKQDASAQYTIGQIYTFAGYGIQKDYKLAAKWYKKAMKNGNLGAKLTMGTFYVHGLGVKKNCYKGLALYQELADKNMPLAQDSLGHLYFEGRCVTKDIKKAKYWIRKGHQNGNTNIWFWHMQNWGPIE